MSKRVAIARIEKGGKRFEILVDPEKAWAYKSGAKIDIREVVEGEFVYFNARQGLKASETELKKIFRTDDFYKIADEIIRRGEVQLTEQQRREMIEAKRKQIIEFLSRNAIDPRTNLPHPPKRIELALQQARVPIDPFKPVEEQVNVVLKALVRVLPIKLATARIGVKIPPEYSGKAYGRLAKMGRIVRQAYTTDGSLIMEIEVPAGLQESVIQQVLRLTKGKGEAKILSVK